MIREQHTRTHAAAFCSVPVPANGSEPIVLMATQTERPGNKVARRELLATGAPPFLACEQCRWEGLSVHSILYLLDVPL